MLKHRSVRGFDLRPEQEQIVKRALQAFDDGKDIVILQAPTGTGKSIIGRSIATAFQSSYLLTPTKSLQDQYYEDFDGPDFKMLKGKSNYECTFQKNTSVEDADCQHERGGKTIRNCQEDGLCPYYEARSEAILSRCTLLNFAAYLTWMRIGSQQEVAYFSHRDLHVIDEAHKIEDDVANHISINLGEWMIKRYLRGHTQELPELKSTGTSEEAYEYLKQVKPLIKARLEELADIWDVSEKMLVTLSFENKDIEKEVRPLMELDQKIDWITQEGVENYALGFGYEEPRGKNKGGPMVSAKPLNVGGFIKTHVLGRKTLLMSATLPMTETWATNLGLENFEIIDIQSGFPAKNRPIWFTPVGSMKKGGDVQLVDAAASKIGKIIEKFAGEKGIIHTPSYKYTKLLKEAVGSSDRFLWCLSGADSEGHLDIHCEDKDEPTILVSPAMREGIDLKEHLSRFQIVVKAPFDSLGDPAIKKKMERNPQWYNMRTLTNFLQMYGRSIRTPTDHARTYILDDDLKVFLNKNRKHIPGYILDAIHW